MTLHWGSIWPCIEGQYDLALSKKGLVVVLFLYKPNKNIFYIKNNFNVKKNINFSKNIF